MDKLTEKNRASEVKRRFPAILRELGFTKSYGASGVRIVDGHTCKVGLQKFRHQSAFRIIMSIEPKGEKEGSRIIDYSDKYTYRDSPSGKIYDFGIRWGDKAAEKCANEIRDFIENVALPWFVRQAGNLEEDDKSN